VLCGSVMHQVQRQGFGRAKKNHGWMGKEARHLWGGKNPSRENGNLGGRTSEEKLRMRTGKKLFVGGENPADAIEGAVREKSNNQKKNRREGKKRELNPRCKRAEKPVTLKRNGVGKADRTEERQQVRLAGWGNTGVTWCRRPPSTPEKHKKTHSAHRDAHIWHWNKQLALRQSELQTRLRKRGKSSPERGGFCQNLQPPGAPKRM